LLTRYRRTINAYFDRVAAGISSLPPNAVTSLSLLASVLSAALYYLGFVQFGGVMLLVSGALDVMDGAVARITGRVTRFGGFLDSTFDRMSDFAVLGGIALSGIVDWRLVMFTVFGSFLVPYCRARGEAAGSTGMAVGIAERAERQVILALASMVHPLVSQVNLLEAGVAIIGILAWVTVAQRILAARRTLKD
jgi:archaetidylinositol phosphate synthase